MGFDAEFSRALAARGWVGMTLPQAYGGGGKDAFDRFVLAEELLCVARRCRRTGSPSGKAAR